MNRWVEEDDKEEEGTVGVGRQETWVKRTVGEAGR